MISASAWLLSLYIDVPHDHNEPALAQAVMQDARQVVCVSSRAGTGVFERYVGVSRIWPAGASAD